MEYLISIITSVVASLVSGVLVFILQSVIKENRELKEKKEAADANEQNALKEGVLCLLRVKLIEYHTKYTKTKSISSHGLDNWLMMYQAYKSLGGNGMIEHMKEEIEELHIA